MNGEGYRAADTLHSISKWSKRKIVLTAHPLLCELPCTLILRVPQQLKHPTLIRRETRNLADDGTHKLGACRLNALALGRLDGLRDGGCGVALVESTASV